MTKRTPTCIVFVKPDGTEAGSLLIPTHGDSPPPRQFDEHLWDVPACLTEFRGALLANDDSAAMACMRAMDRLGCWHEAFESLITGPHVGKISGESLLRFWTTYGFHIADSMQGDPLLIDAMKRLLPRYTGAGLVLYRGEDAERYRRRAFGMSWTTQIDTARMFARRRDPPGAVLRLDASAAIILCGPTDHSRYLDEHEYLIDTREMGEPELLA